MAPAIPRASNAGQTFGGSRLNRPERFISRAGSYVADGKGRKMSTEGFDGMYEDRERPNLTVRDTQLHHT